MKMATGFTTAALVLAGTSASAALVNGDFEAATFDTGWTNVGVTAGAELVNAGNTASASFDGTDSLSQDFAAVTAEEIVDGSIDMYLRFDSFSATSATRIRLRGDNNIGDIATFRVNSAGRLQRFSGGVWGDITDGTNTIDFSTGMTYHVQFNFNDLDDAGRTFDVSISAGSAADPSGVLPLTTTVAGNTGFHSAAVGTTFQTVTLEAGNAAFRLDEVAVTVVPEPGSLALLGLGGLMIARRRRG